ncbi:MAG TPA: YkgJ family cysteine cluster protein [Anaeromyxobacter sp.]|nr:YkgJ family cysteine cluster protein [Anaeromyxobacter sp.]
MIGSAVVRLRARVLGLASRALGSARGERDLAALLDAVWAAIEEERGRTPAPDRPRPACRAGCASCCRVNVGTLAIEGAAVAARLRSGADGARRRAAELLAFHDRVRWLEDRERAAEDLRCPFLDAEARCAIHPVRPLACRGLTSLDAADCARALSGETPDDDGEAGLVRMDLLQKALHDEARAALAEVLAARGLDARCRDVSGMTAAFLADPGLAAAFLSGARVPLT